MGVGVPERQRAFLDRLARRAGDPRTPAAWPPRPPITRAELAAGVADLHPVEVAFDTFKAELRRAR